MDNIDGLDRHLFGSGNGGMGKHRRTKSTVSNSYSATDVPELTFPAGYNPMCPTCGVLAYNYGPDDNELQWHIDGYADDYHYTIGDPNNPNSHEYYPAG